MVQNYDIKGMSSKIGALRKTATELVAVSGGIPAVEKNVERLMACVTALEMDIVDVQRILDGKGLD